MSEVAKRFPPGEVLDSWKEIAVYLGRDVSTAQRWEHCRGLPIHRLQGGKRGAVYALKPELDAWRYQTRADAGGDNAGRARRWPAWHQVGMALAAAGAVAIFAWSGLSRSADQPLQFVPLASLPGEEVYPAFSADGSRIVFSYLGEERSDFDLYIKVVGAGVPLQLTSTRESEIEPQWSPDSSQVAFLRASNSELSVWVMGALGGSERRIAKLRRGYGSVGRAIAWPSPGDSLIISDRDVEKGPFSLYSLHLESGARRRLTEPPPDSVGDSDPACSPDGRTVAFLRHSQSRVTDIWVMPASGGKPSRVTKDNQMIAGLAWAEEGEQLVFVSSRGGTEPALWKVPAAGGRPRLLSVVPPYSKNVAVSGRSGRIAYSRYGVRSSIWRYSLDQAGAAAAKPERLISSSRLEAHPQYSPDGQSIAFMSDRSGFMEVWTARSDGSGARQLTDFRGPEGGGPHWSPDGKTIAFDMRLRGNPDVFIVSAEGGPVRQLVDHPSDDGAPSWSRDGKWVYFASNRTGEYQVWRTAGQGGKPQQITRGGGTVAFESFDGAILYYAKGRNQLGLWRKALPDGEEQSLASDYSMAYFGNWQVTRRGLYCLDAGGVRHSSPVVRLLPFDGGGVRDVTIVDDSAWRYSADVSVGVSRYHMLAISPDHRSMLLTQLDRSQSDIMVAEGFR